jgi:hypothetical protein
MEKRSQVRVHRYPEFFTRFILRYRDKAVLDIAPTHLEDVTQTLSRIERKGGSLPEVWARILRKCWMSFQSHGV